MLRAQIDNDRDSVGGSGIPEVTFRPLSFAEHRRFAKRSHVKHRKIFDMTYFGSTRVVDQASAHSLPRVFTVAGRHIALNRQRFLKQIEGLFVQVLKAIINSQRETTALAQHFGIMSSEPY